jgi:hypothetical protein
MGDFTGFVNVGEARALCESGWPNGSGEPGTLAEGECATEGALARCRVQFDYIAIDYFYEGFADTETRADPIAPLSAACTKVGGTLERPPFP